jgi:hypothetical protein
MVDSSIAATHHLPLPTSSNQHKDKTVNVAVRKLLHNYAGGTDEPASVFL